MAEHGSEWGLADWQIFLDSPMAIEATEVYCALPPSLRRAAVPRR
jgi:hypothetical protein